LLHNETERRTGGVRLHLDVRTLGKRQHHRPLDVLNFHIGIKHKNDGGRDESTAL